MQQLFEAAPMRTKEVMVDEQYTEAYSDKEEYKEPYLKNVTKSVSETVLVPYTDTVTETKQETYLERGNQLGKILTLGLGFQDQLKHKDVEVERKVDKLREETRTKNVPVQEEASRTAWRSVTKYNTKTRQVPKTVEFKVPIEQFRDR